MSEEINNKQKFNFLEFYKKNKNKIFSIIFVFILSIIILIVLNEFKKKQNVEISKKYNSAKILIENNENQEALKILENIISKNNSFYSPSSLLLQDAGNLSRKKLSPKQNHTRLLIFTQLKDCLRTSIVWLFCRFTPETKTRHCLPLQMIFSGKKSYNKRFLKRFIYLQARCNRFLVKKEYLQ